VCHAAELTGVLMSNLCWLIDVLIGVE